MKGSYTVEAVILLPFIILCTFVGIYMSIYVYDRALMLQDAENVCCLMLLGENPSKEDLLSHPYLSVSNLKLTTAVRETEVSATITGDWLLPVVPSFNRQLTFTVSRRKADPVFIMFLTEDIKTLGGLYEEWISSESKEN